MTWGRQDGRGCVGKRKEMQSCPGNQESRRIHVSMHVCACVCARVRVTALTSSARRSRSRCCSPSPLEPFWGCTSPQTCGPSASPGPGPPPRTLLCEHKEEHRVSHRCVFFFWEMRYAFHEDVFIATLLKPHISKIHFTSILLTIICISTLSVNRKCF